MPLRVSHIRFLLTIWTSRRSLLVFVSIFVDSLFCWGWWVVSRSSCCWWWSRMFWWRALDWGCIRGCCCSGPFRYQQTNHKLYFTPAISAVKSTSFFFYCTKYLSHIKSPTFPADANARIVRVHNSDVFQVCQRTISMDKINRVNIQIDGYQAGLKSAIQTLANNLGVRGRAQHSGGGVTLYCEGLGIVKQTCWWSFFQVHFNYFWVSRLTHHAATGFLQLRISFSFSNNIYVAVDQHVRNI